MNNIGNAIVVTEKGLAIILVDRPCPPRLEVMLPGPGTENDVAGLFPTPPVQSGYVIRGPGQERCAIYETPCKT